MNAFSRYSLASALVLSLSVCGAGGGAMVEPEPQETPPRLVVLVVVDQLRADLLEAYSSVFTGGFRRLRENGFQYLNATHDHANTLTAPGHASLVSGTPPSRHGVISNLWWTQGAEGWQAVENVMDAETPIVGDDAVVGASPEVLARSTLAEWLQDEYDDAKVVSVSGKARAAVLMAGRADAEVYWFHERSGSFVTSTYYRDKYPGWMEDFNEDVIAPMAADTVWDLSIPDDARGLSRPDSADYEGDGIHTTFPHNFRDSESLFAQADFWTWWSGTPLVDRATRLLAQTAAEEEGLGEDEIPDFLAISFSGTDRVGHAYGPMSLEQLDNLYRLDQELGALMDWLDARVGPDQWVVAVSADHGVADTPEYAAEQGRPAYRLTRDSAMALQGVMNEAARNAKNDVQRLIRGLAEGLPSVGWVEQAWPVMDLYAPEAQADSFTVLHSQSVYRGRYAGILGRQGVELRVTADVLLWSYLRGTTHGSAYYYDRHVPFILAGSGVEPGVSEEAVSAMDMAPTLARIMGIPVPDDLDGVAREGRPGG